MKRRSIVVGLLILNGVLAATLWTGSATTQVAPAAAWRDCCQASGGGGRALLPIVLLLGL